MANDMIFGRSSRQSKSLSAWSLGSGLLNRPPGEGPSSIPIKRGGWPVCVMLHCSPSSSNIRFGLLITLRVAVARKLLKFLTGILGLSGSLQTEESWPKAEFQQVLTSAYSTAPNSSCDRRLG